MGLVPPYDWDGFDAAHQNQNEPVEENFARDPYEEKYANDLQVEDQTDSNRNPFAPAAWISGWYYGLSGHDKEEKLYECFIPDRNLTDKLYDAMESFIAGDKKSGEAYMAGTKPLFRRALLSC